MPYQNNRLRDFVRKWAKPFLFVSSFALVVSSPFLLNYGLKSSIEGFASRLNGAQVTIRDFDISVIRGNCLMQGIAVASHTSPMVNVLELDEVRFDFEFLPLLAFRLVVPQVFVEGVRYRTARERSGVLPSEDAGLLPPTALFDRIAPGIYDSIKSQLGETPLRNLGQLTLGIAMRNSVDPHQQELEVYQRLKSLELELDRTLATWDLENEKTLHLPPSERVAKVQALRNRVQKEMVNLGERANRIFDATNRDVERILRKIGIPSLSTDDFTRELIGRRTLNQLEKLAYWIDLSRRKMGLNSWADAQNLTKHAGPMPDARPRLYVKRITVHSVAGSDLHKGDVNGEIVELASEPMGADKPLRIDIQAAFPGLRILGVRLHAVFNHSDAEPREDIDFTIASAPVVDWPIETSQDLGLTVASGSMGLAFNSQMNGNTFSGNWTSTLKNANFVTSSRYTLMENALRNVLEPLASAITVAGSVGGTVGKVDFKMQSNAGRLLAASLNEKFRAPMKTAVETIQDEIRDRFSPPVKKLQDRIQNAGSRYDRRLIEALELLGASTKPS